MSRLHTASVVEVREEIRTRVILNVEMLAGIGGYVLNYT